MDFQPFVYKGQSLKARNHPHAYHISHSTLRNYQGRESRHLLKEETRARRQNVLPSIVYACMAEKLSCLLLGVDFMYGNFINLQKR